MGGGFVQKHQPLRMAILIDGYINWEYYVIPDGEGSEQRPDEDVGKKTSDPALSNKMSCVSIPA